MNHKLLPACVFSAAPQRATTDLGPPYPFSRPPHTPHLLPTTLPPCSPATRSPLSCQRRTATHRPSLRPSPCPLQPSYALTLELSEEDRNYDDKADILEQGGMPLSSEFLLRADSSPDDQLLPVLRLLNLQGAWVGGWVGGQRGLGGRVAGWTFR